MLSVIIPTFNRATVLKNAIDSVLAQSCPVDEIIVVDDGSSDNTKDIVNAFGNKVRYFYQNNSGVSAARNYGIRVANGDWIAFLDSDDTWVPEKIAMQLEAVKINSCEVSMTAHYEDGIDFVTHAPLVGYGKTNIYQNSLELVIKTKHHPLVQSLLVKKSLLLKLGCFDETLKVAEDTKLIYRLAYHCKIAYINFPLFSLTRKRSQSGLSDEKSVNAALQRYECFYRVQCEAYCLALMSNPELLSVIRYNKGYFLSRVGELLAVKGDYRRARVVSFEGMRYFSGLKSLIRCMLVLMFPNIVVTRARKNLFK